MSPSENMAGVEPAHTGVPRQKLIGYCTQCEQRIINQIQYRLQNDENLMRQLQNDQSQRQNDDTRSQISSSLPDLVQETIGAKQESANSQLTTDNVPKIIALVAPVVLCENCMLARISHERIIRYVDELERNRTGITSQGIQLKFERAKKSKAAQNDPFNTDHAFESLSRTGKQSSLAHMHPLGYLQLNEHDVARLNKSLEMVKVSGFYHGSLSMENARRRLRGASVGSFLLRESSDKKYVMSISIKTDRGTTSIRIQFKDGLFRLDCEQSAYQRMSSFPCLLKLVEHYVDSAKANTANSCVFLERTGRRDTPVLLRKPFLSQPHGLKHLARLQLNQMLDEERKRKVLLFMHPNIESFLLAYPYKV